MKLGSKVMKEITTGAVHIEEDNDGIFLNGFTLQQEELELLR